METRLDEPAHRIVELLVTQPSAFDIPTLLASNLVDPRTRWTRFHSDTPLGRLRRLGLAHLGIRTLNGDDYVYVGVPEQLQDAISTWLEANH